MKNKNLFFCILLLFFFQKNTFSQAPDFKFTRIGVNEGLSQGAIRDIAKDNLGHLWFATADGLNRYDGYDFHTYHHHGEDSTSIVSGDVLKIFKDSRGNLWLSTEGGGLGKYTAVFDRFQKIITKSKKNIFPFFEDNLQSIWCANEKGEILSFDSRTGKENGYFVSPIYNQEEKINLISANNELILFFFQKKVVIFNCINKIWSEQPLPNFRSEPSVCLFFKNNYWIGNKKGEVWQLDIRFQAITTIPISSAPVTSINTFGNTDIIIGSEAGMYFYSPFTQSKYAYTSDINNPFSLSSNKIQRFGYDDSGNLWVGTSTSGLNKSMYNSNKFNVLRAADYYLVKALHKDEKRNLLYAAVHKRGLEIYNLQTPSVAPILIPSSNNYTFIEPVGDNYLLLFSQKEVELFNKETKKFTSQNEKITSTLGSSNFNISAANRTNEHEWVFVANQSILTLNQNQFVVKTITQIPPDVEVTSVFSDKNTYWLGTTKGLYQFSNNNWQKILDNSYIKYILPEADKSLWVASTSGLYHYFPSTNTAKLYDEKYGLSNNFIYGVLKDNNGNLWVSHNKGLSRFNPKLQYFRNYTLMDGLQSLEFNTGAFCRSEIGTLAFGGIGGINFFDSEQIAENPVTPKPLISKIRVNDDDFKTDTCIWYKKFIALRYDQNTVSFEFVGLQFSNTAQNEYKYLLEGVDKDWINTGNRRFARYANLAPGIYTFKVKAANSDGKWNETAATITVKIIAPFWMSWWFKTLAILALLTIIGNIIFYFQQRRIVLQKRKIEIQQQVISERERISRDLHDNIGAQITYIMSSMDWAMTQVPDTQFALKDRLTGLRSNTQSLMSNLRDTIWTLNKDAITPQDFSDRLKQYVSYNIQRHETFEVAFFEDINSNNIIAPNIILNLFRICQEAIQNAVKHSKASVLTISIICNDNEELKIAISDDGIGFTSEKNREDSFGLDNMRYRAAEIGASINIRAAEKKGVSVEILLPLKKITHL